MFNVTNFNKFIFHFFQHRSEIRKIEGNNIKSVHVDASNLVKPNEMTKVLIEITNGKKNAI